jgi:hypothetical protein
MLKNSVRQTMPYLCSYILGSNFKELYAYFVRDTLLHIIYTISHILSELDTNVGLDLHCRHIDSNLFVNKQLHPRSMIGLSYASIDEKNTFWGAPLKKIDRSSSYSRFFISFYLRATTCLYLYTTMLVRIENKLLPITNRDGKIIYRGIIPLVDDLLYVCQHITLFATTEHLPSVCPFA